MSEFRRGFTTLSATLGSLALSLHDGLLQAAANEADPAALTAVLRGLCVLICSAPYPRLPPTLLPRTLSVRRLPVHQANFLALLRFTEAFKIMDDRVETPWEPPEAHRLHQTAPCHISFSDV